MPAITTDAPRFIIDDFVKVIQETKRRQGPKPAKDVINFRDEKRNGFERDASLSPSGISATEKKTVELHRTFSIMKRVMGHFLRKTKMLEIFSENFWRKRTQRKRTS